jgi:hypothetical protein
MNLGARSFAANLAIAKMMMAATEGAARAPVQEVRVGQQRKLSVAKEPKNSKTRDQGANPN